MHNFSEGCIVIQYEILFAYFSELKTSCSMETYNGYYGGETNAVASQADNEEACEIECANSMGCQAFSFTDRSSSYRCLLYYMEPNPAFETDSKFWKINCGPGNNLQS